MNVGVIMAVNVIAPVIVAALVNGNETVAVIDAVSDHAAQVDVDQRESLERTCRDATKLEDP